MRIPRRRGITSVDLAAVVAVVGLLALLAAPALLRARTEADRAGCADNLRRVTLALRGFEATNDGELIRNLYGPQLPGLGDAAHHGGLPLLLPYLEQQALYDRYNFQIHFTDPANQAVTATHVPDFQCPSAPPGRLSLPGNPRINPSWRGSVSDYASIRQSVFPVGPSHDPYGLGALEQRLSDVEQVRVYRSMITDGLSSTIAFAERAGLPAVWAKGRQVDDGTSVNTPINDEPRGPWAGYACINLATFTEDGMDAIPGGPCSINCRNVFGSYNNGGLYSFHPGGAHASFMDGSVRFLREGMSPDVLFALGSRAGGEVVSPEDDGGAVPSRSQSPRVPSAR